MTQRLTCHKATERRKREKRKKFGAKQQFEKRKNVGGRDSTENSTFRNHLQDIRDGAAIRERFFEQKFRESENFTSSTNYKVYIARCNYSTQPNIERESEWRSYDV